MKPIFKKKEIKNKGYKNTVMVLCYDSWLPSKTEVSSILEVFKYIYREKKEHLQVYFVLSTDSSYIGCNYKGEFFSRYRYDQVNNILFEHEYPGLNWHIDEYINQKLKEEKEPEKLMQNMMADRTIRK